MAAERAKERKELEDLELITQYIPDQRKNSMLYSRRPAPRYVEPVTAEDVGFSKELETKTVGEICKEIHLLDLEKTKAKEAQAQARRAMNTEGQPQKRTLMDFMPKAVAEGGNGEPSSVGSSDEQFVPGTGKPKPGQQFVPGPGKLRQRASHQQVAAAGDDAPNPGTPRPASTSIRGRSRPSRRQRHRTPSPIVSSFCCSSDSDSSDVYFSALSSLPSVDLDETETETETDDE